MSFMYVILTQMCQSDVCRFDTRQNFRCVKSTRALVENTLCLVYIDPLSLLSMSLYCSNISHYQSQNTFAPVYPSRFGISII